MTTTTVGIDNLPSEKSRFGANNDGVVKVNFGTAGQPTYWAFNLTAGNVEVNTGLSFPNVGLTYSTTLNWPRSPKSSGWLDLDLVQTDLTFGRRWLENGIDKQAHWWTIDFDYTRSDASTDNQIRFVFKNPISGFERGIDTSLRKGNNRTYRGTVIIPTYADGASIGAGYQLWASASVNLSVRIISIARESVFRSFG